MTTPTTNLGLTLYNNTTDQSGSFTTWQQDMSGSVGSNMIKIDSFAGSASGSISNLSSNISGSVSTINSTISTLSGSITTILANLATLNLRLQKIDEFTDIGQANFNNISGSFTHLLLMGVTSASHTTSNPMHVGIDFNGDANSSHYAYTYWWKGGTLESFGLSTDSLGGLGIGDSLPRNAFANIGTPLFAIIPNYSSSDEYLYKSAMGIMVNYNITISGGGLVKISGGYWSSYEPITRIRVFAFYDTAKRYDFYSGTKISLYGLG